MNTDNSPTGTRRFLRFSIREVLVLVVVVGILLALYAPAVKESYWKRRLEGANQELLTAAADGDRDGVTKAIAAGADLSALDERGCNALYYAAKRTDLALLDILIGAGADPDCVVWGRVSEKGDTPLALAIRDNNVTMARRLLVAGADPHDRYTRQALPHKYTASQLPLLHLCIDKSYAEMMRLLVEHGVPTEANGTKAMDLAVRHSNAQMGDLLREFGGQYTPREAAAFNRLDDLQRMVDEDPALISQRFDPVYHRQPGPTLLGMALERGYLEIAMYLVDCGAPLEVLEYNDATLLHLAAKGGRPEMLQLLLRRGLEVDARDRYQDTPLHEAVRHNRAEAVATLIEAGANVNARSNIGGQSTPLMCAVTNNSSQQVVRLLLAAEANPALTNLHGQTASDLAENAGNRELLELLEKSGSRGDGKGKELVER